MNSASTILRPPPHQRRTAEPDSESKHRTFAGALERNSRRMHRMGTNGICNSGACVVWEQRCVPAARKQKSADLGLLRQFDIYSEGCKTGLDGHPKHHVY